MMFNFDFQASEGVTGLFTRWRDLDQRWCVLLESLGLGQLETETKVWPSLCARGGSGHTREVLVLVSALRIFVQHDLRPVHRIVKTTLNLQNQRPELANTEPAS